MNHVDLVFVGGSNRSSIVSLEDIKHDVRDELQMLVQHVLHSFEGPVRIQSAQEAGNTGRSMMSIIKGETEI